MKITMIGTGYVGLVTGACFAEVGNDVLGFDVDRGKIAVLESGGVPIHEPGLDAMIARNVAAGRLRFTTDVDAAVAHGAVQFIAVGTPPEEDGSADMSYVLQAARDIGARMDGWKIIVDKSTVPVGTAAKVDKAEDKMAKAADKSEDKLDKAGDKSASAAKKTGRAIDDGWIKSKIYAQYMADWNTVLNDSDIDIDVSNNMVTLNGTVKSAEARTKAVSIAKGTDGVKSVKDNLKVAAATR